MDGKPDEAIFDVAMELLFSVGLIEREAPVDGPRLDGWRKGEREWQLAYDRAELDG